MSVIARHEGRCIQSRSNHVAVERVGPGAIREEAIIGVRGSNCKGDN